MRTSKRAALKKVCTRYRPYKIPRRFTYKEWIKTIEKSIFRDVYNLWLKYKTLEGLENIADDVSHIAEKYNNEPLCNDLLLAVVNHIQRTSSLNEPVTK